MPKTFMIIAIIILLYQLSLQEKESLIHCWNHYQDNVNGNHIFNGCNFDTNDIDNNFMDKDIAGNNDDGCHAAVVMVSDLHLRLWC